MSDFYKRRRIAIKDVTALLAFFFGYVWSGVFAWPYLTAELDRGNMIRGLGYFLAAVLATGIATGLVGLQAGSLLGGLWERYHRFRRGHVSRRSHSSIESRPLRPAVAHGDPSAVPRAITIGPVISVSRVRYASGRFDTAKYVALAERVCPGKYDVQRMHEALGHSVNVTAWDDDRLVGVVRVVTDGYLCSAVPEIMVDPDYQGQGIGRALLQQALAATPSERLLIYAPPATVGFFERAGCIRGVTGFTLAHAS